MGKSVYIAEKPSVAQEFAKALHLNLKRKDGYLESDEAIVTWCVGHLVTMSYPEVYDEKYKKQAEDALEKFRQRCPDASFAIGECLNADPFELSLALIRYGFSVPEIYGTITVENFTYIRSLAKISPETKVFSNMEPTMIYYDPAKSDVNLAIGKDACYYHPDCPYVMWNGEEQPYGYAGVRRLFEQLLEVV